MKFKVLKKQNNSDMCIVCGVKNDASLKSVFYELEGNIIVGITTPLDIHQSYPNRMHGGMISSLLDETLGRAAQINHPDLWAVTGELSVRYKKPVLLNEPIKCVAKITRDFTRGYIAEGFVENEKGEILATAKGTYVKAPIEKISENFLNENTWFYVNEDLPETIEIANASYFV